MWAQGPVRAQGVAAALTPSVVDVIPGAQFDLDISVPVPGHPFNGFDAVIGYDPAALTLIPRSPISLQEGALMVGACGSTFHLFRQGADTDTITDVLLCDRVALSGPGQIYHFQFQASTTPQITVVHLLPGVRFFNDGLFIEPVYTTDALVSISWSSDVERLEASQKLRLQVRPNPVVDHTVFRIQAGAADPGPVTILDLQGRIVRRLEEATGSAGNWLVAWDRRDTAGGMLPSGIYFVTCDVGGHVLSARVSVVR
jgi:hypothetical protein